MKLHFQNPTLAIAVAASVLVHGALLTVRFVAPEAFRFRPADPALEVILVNAKHDKKPLKAQALAQANLDGGGNADAGRAKSPLPNMNKVEEGDSIQAAMQRRIAELEERQRQILAQTVRKTAFTSPRMAENNKPEEAPPTPDGADNKDAKAMALSEAEINKRVELYNQRPKKTQITPSTMGVEYAIYHTKVTKLVEKVGTLNFPKQGGKNLYGELVISIPILHDGTIYEKEGGPRVEQSSNIPALDKAALRIARSAAPFGKFPSNMRTSGKDDVWEIISKFTFTKEAVLEAEARGSGQ